jgi:glucose-1-phosphate adenylyltransferase
MNIMVMKRTYLLSIIRDAIAHGFTNFYRDIIARNLDESNCYSYTYDGYYLIVNSLEGYFKCSMKLLTSEARNGLFGIKNRPVYTKVRNSVPTKYISGATIKNSLIADGCIIEGVVENSIIFRGVKVGKGSVIKNSVIMQDTYTGSNVNLNYVITDKNVIIKDNRVLSGYDTLPFYINKGAMV